MPTEIISIVIGSIIFYIASYRLLQILLRSFTKRRGKGGKLHVK